MKNLLIVVLCLTTIGLSAQRGKHKRGEKIEALKIAFITEAIDLSSAQAEKFWPIYNEYQLKHKKTRREIRALSMQDETNLTEEQALQRIETYLELEEALVSINKDQISSLRTVISNKQIIALLRSKDRFKKEILDGLNRKRRNRKGE